MRKAIQEVVYLNTGWTIESFAWAKELARSLHASFHILKANDMETTEQFERMLLRGDGYYIIHYQQPPLKTHVTNLPDNFAQQVGNYLAHYPGAALVVTSSENPFRVTSPDLNRHIIITVPTILEKDDTVPEFVSILNQAKVLNWPKDLIQSLRQPWFARFKQRLSSLL